jgi:glutamate-5-semialdehyde dehydrogenase
MIKNEVKKICNSVKKAFEENKLTTALKNDILKFAAKLLRQKADDVIFANKKDIENAKNSGLDEAKIDRLTLNESRIEGLAKSLLEIAELEDPTDKILYETTRNNGLHIKRISVPIGILLAIFESRPNVAIDIAALALKSGNAAILRSGSESLNSAKILIEIFGEALAHFGIDKNLIYLVQDPSRDYVKHLLKMDEFIDVVIPRGGKSLIEAVAKSTKIPVFKHLDGNCHTYIHENADFDKARKILLNAKLRRVSICGATESLLIDAKIAKEILPLIAHDLYVNQCEMRGDKASQKIDARIKLASAKDFSSEYLDKIISIKIVKNVKEAISHINKFSSSHTESIITEDENATKEFFAGINSAIVMHNASTQFADGGEFGLGAEVGISTGKLHARGPVGLEQLTTYKYLVDANCAIRS